VSRSVRQLLESLSLALRPLPDADRRHPARLTIAHFRLVKERSAGPSRRRARSRIICTVHGRAVMSGTVNVE
jgi:hypothetical protein